MAGVITEDYEAIGSRSDDLEGMSSEQRCQSGDSIAEWRTSEQVENGTPSTSSLFIDTGDEDDCGPKPSELFGRFTWKIDNFSTINKRELRSDIFEVGGYKWYVLIYPQGCDVCNHLSLFLCVADHDKLLPGWSHFAQFTISVVNKDIKKSKYSDTLHRFWKKEHDWGWKKFMELSKVYDGFVNADALVIKAQVQVIREKAHRLFRCLDCQYRRELVRIYLSNVEQICRRFIDEKTGELGKLTEDKTRWPSFHSFWSGTDLNSRRRMSSDKTDAILKVIVKHFFIEKEVTSTLVMDSLYSGLKVLEFQSKNNNGGTKFLDLEKLPSAMVRVDEGMFVLADDIVPLLERVVKEPLPYQPLPPKDDKYSQNRTKDGSSGEEFSKDSVERDERRLMELGRRTVEIFVLFHIFSRIEVAYQEAVALRMQEELIQEEAASHADRAKCGGTEKDKRSKKKQAKLKRNTRKGKDKGSNDIFDVVQEKKSQESLSDVSVLGDSISKEVESVEKINTLEDASDVYHNANVVEVLHPVLDDKDAHVNCDTDPSEVILPTEVSVMQPDKMNQSSFCDSFSTCSTELVPSVMMNGSYNESSWSNNKILSTLNRGRNNQDREEHSKAAMQKFSSTRSDAPSKCGSSHDVAATEPESDAVVLSLKSEFQKTQKHSDDKDVEVASVQKELIDKDQVDADTFSKSKIREPSSSSQVGKPTIIVQQAKHNSEASNSIALCLTNSTEFSSTSDPPSCCLPPRGSKLPPLESKFPLVSSTSKFGTQKYHPPAKSPGAHQASSVLRPSHVPLMPAQTLRPVVSTVQSAPLLSRLVSASGRLGTGPSPPAPSYAPQSYRNVIVGKSATVTNATTTTLGHQTTSNQSIMYPHPLSTFMASSPVPPAHTSDRIDQISSARPDTFGFSNTDALSSWQLSSDDSLSEGASSSGRYSQGVFVDEFPHMDIINDLLNDENNGRASGIHHRNFSQQYSFPYSSSAIDIGSLSLSAQFNQSEQLYDHGFQSAYATSTNPLQGLQNGHLSELGFSAYANSAYASATSPHQGLRNGHLSQHDLSVYANSAYASSTAAFQGLRNGHLSQHDLSAYDNSQIEGAIESQQPYGQHAEISIPDLGNGDTNRYTARRLPDNSGQSSGVNGYMYRHFSRP